MVNATNSSVIVMLNFARRVVGIVVDSVSKVLALSTDRIEPAPAFKAMRNTRYSTGLGPVNDGESERMRMLADIEQRMTGADMGLMHIALQRH